MLGLRENFVQKQSTLKGLHIFLGSSLVFIFDLPDENGTQGV